jgi:hypothetical protein
MKKTSKLFLKRHFLPDSNKIFFPLNKENKLSNFFCRLLNYLQNIPFRLDRLQNRRKCCHEKVSASQMKLQTTNYHILDHKFLTLLNSSRLTESYLKSIFSDYKVTFNYVSYYWVIAKWRHRKCDQCSPNDVTQMWQVVTYWRHILSQLINLCNCV